ncbi:hypothetical protein BDV18DRAFT_161571 [Aspergillus unguis]
MSLSTNDSAVLQALFDAESSPSGVKVDSTLPSLPAHLNISPQDHAVLQAQEKHIITPLSSPNISPDTLKTAITALDVLIDEHPTYPSAYANRAQAVRMLLDSDPESESSTEYLSSVLNDLEKAISLATPLSPTDAISPFQGKLLADSHTHRGYLLLKISKQLKERGQKGVPESLIKIGADRLEEISSQDFFLGGRYGNKVAQQMAVQTNPYAKMCGAIVKEAMRKEVESSF